MNQEQILAEAEAFAREQHAGDASGHDWWHVYRVARMAGRLARDEGADTFVCELAAWLHDVADDKVAGDEATGLARVRDWLADHNVPETTASQVIEIITTMSFASGKRGPLPTVEGRVVQDADRLDAIGAIGIARAFAFGGSRGRSMHEPGQAPRQYGSKAEYRASTSSTINHFHEKLLLLKDRMNTASGRQIAEERHRAMEAFLVEFAAEWEGER